MPKYYYKVTDLNMGSCVIAAKGIKIKYYLSKWVEPKAKGSLIFVFEKLEEARDFIYSQASCYRIFRCLARNPKKCDIRIIGGIDYENISRSALKNFWTGKHTDFWKSNAPGGTYFAESIKLVSEVIK